MALPTSGAVARYLRQRREGLGWTLREVEAKTRELGQPIPFGTLSRVEKGKYDPGLKRLHLLFRLYGVDLEIAAELLDLEELASDLPEVGSDPQATYEEAVREWKAGNTRKGLAGLLALRTLVPDGQATKADRQKWLHTLAVFVGAMGRYRLSRQIEEELLLEPPAPELIVPILVQMAVCWHRLGSTEMALALLARAEGHTKPGDHRERGWVFQDRASVLATLEQYTGATKWLKRAIAEYTAGKDEHAVSGALATQCRLHAEQGNWAAALDAARNARDHAERHGFARLAIMRMIDTGRALVKLGKLEPGIATLNESLQRVIAAGDDVCRFYVHYYLAEAFNAQGNSSRAAMERGIAQYYVRFVDEQTPEAVEMRGDGARSATPRTATGTLSPARPKGGGRKRSR